MPNDKPNDKPNHNTPDAANSPAPFPTSVAASPQILERNLAALGRVSPRTAELVRTAAPAELQFEIARDGSLTATDGLRRLASARAPLDEADRFAEQIDVETTGLAVVLGMGLGHHAAAVANKLGGASVMIVFEPDLPILRAVLERVDHSAWLGSGACAVLTDPEDASALQAVIRGVEGLAALGISVVEHQPSKPRLAGREQTFATTLTGVARVLRTTVMTTLLQVETTLRNLMMNADWYAGAPGVGELAGAASGKPAVVVSGGPSLRRNLHLLAEPGVRDRVVIIAAQTVLKPMLRAGIKPHFVTALDYHEISARFYEGLTKEDVDGITLIFDPKGNPAIVNAWPGAVRTPCDDTLRHFVTDDRRTDHATVPPGATVAHLAYGVARHLGCDPVILIGQDLAFTDGQYYGSGATIHDTWANELSTVNTLEMLEWQRIKRFPPHLLRKATDHLGRPVYADDQMRTYLLQFEAMFARDRQQRKRIIDATEGGVAKQHTLAMTLAEALAEYTYIDDAAALPYAPPSANAISESAIDIASRARETQRQATIIARKSKRTAEHLRDMICALDAGDTSRVNSLIDRARRTGDDIKQLAPAWPLVQYINQTGSLRRYKADRLIELRALAGEDRQRAQIERDISNVEWTADAAEAIAELMEQTEQAMKTGEKLTRDPKPTDATPEADDAADVTADLAAKLEGTEVAGTRPLSIAAVIDLDLATEQAREHLPRTLQRLAACTELDRVVLLTSTPESVRSAINIDGLDVVCMQPTNAINEGRRSLVRHARALSPHHWRGGLGNATAADSLYDPKRLDEAVNELDLDAALLIGTDWSYLDPATTDDIIARHRQAPDKFRITFAAAGVGLAPVLVSKTIAEEITRGADAPWLLSSVGTLLNYVPVAPQLDLLGKSHCVHVSPAMRDAMLACTATSQIGAAITQQSEPFADAEHIAQLARTVRPDAPAELVLELCPGRHTGGRLARLHWNADEQPERHTIDTALAKRFATELARLDTNAVLTLAGAGDPLLHPGVFAIIEHAKASGVGTVHVCTDLLDDAGTQLAESGADIVSVDLLATSRKTYQALAGIDGYDRAINNIETLLAIAADRTKAGDGMWVVPRITRCDAVYDELEQFYDHWLMRAGCCVIDPLPRAQVGDRIEPIALPALARERLSRTRLCIRSDGRALIDATDFATRAGLQATSLPLSEVWQTVLRSRLAEQAADIEPKPTTREVAA